MTHIDIIVPLYNEERLLRKCLDSIFNFELPENVSIHLFLVDGGSADQTIAIANEYIRFHDDKHITLINNPKKIQSSAMNIAIKKSSGKYILRLDAHTIYEKDYLKHCLETSLRTDADNVGGILDTMPGASSYGAKVVQAISSPPFGVGNSSFRVGANEGPVDTVPFGFFKRSIFKKIGYFDERLVRAQDYEFNSRIISSGGTVWLNPKIKGKYFNQAKLSDFYKKIFFLDAPYNSYMWYLAPRTFSFRHSITSFFASGVIIGFILSYFSYLMFSMYIAILTIYFSLGIISSIHLAIRSKNIIHVFLLPFCFFCFHFVHGVGVLSGLLNLLLRKSPVNMANLAD